MRVSGWFGFLAPDAGFGRCLDAFFVQTVSRARKNWIFDLDVEKNKKIGLSMVNTGTS
jgi:hypothetical protein